jgi:hypothetical protein
VAGAFRSDGAGEDWENVCDMGIASANSPGQDDRLNNLLTCLERAEKARDERRRIGMQRNGRLSAPLHDVPSAGAPNILGNPKSDAQLQPATLRPGMASDADFERMLLEGLPIGCFPGAAQLSPMMEAVGTADIYRRARKPILTQDQQTSPPKKATATARAKGGAVHVSLASNHLKLWLLPTVVSITPDDAMALSIELQKAAIDARVSEAPPPITVEG